MKHCKYCKNIEEIENYASAAADNFVDWDIHHRLETHNSDGERRTVYLSSKELIALGTYYDRPASELIFLKHGDHTRLHHLSQHGTPLSSETKAKMSASRLGKHRSDETRAKIAASHLGKRHSEETRAKMSTSRLGKHFSDETRAKLRAANLGKHLSDETRAKLSNAAKLRLSKTSAKNN